MQVAFENVRPAQPKHAAFVQRKFALSFRLANLGGDARRHFADRTETTRRLDFTGLGRLRLGQINAHDRRSFSQPVAFKHALFEPLPERFGKIEWQFFRAGNDETQAA